MHRCGYCDFTVVAGRDHLIDEYLRALECELQGLETPRNVETLFFGGGTPTHLAPHQLRRLFEIVGRWVVPVEGCEWSVEANPADLTDEKIEVLCEAGVNRVSLGVQSLDAEVLKTLERDHRPDEAIARTRARFANVAVDLIFGVPGQSPSLWEETLQRTIATGVVHLSTYGLTIEKGTTFWSRRKKGTLVPPFDELQREMYAAAMRIASAAGFEQYELSNFARGGFRCRHNDVYWNALPYFAFGPGAARYVDGRRETNHRSTSAWMKRLFAGRSPVAESEELSDEERAREALVLGIRRIEGVDRETFLAQTGFSLDDLAHEAIARNVEGGLLEESATGLQLTYEGRFLADSVVVDLL